MPAWGRRRCSMAGRSPPSAASCRRRTALVIHSRRRRRDAHHPHRRQAAAAGHDLLHRRQRRPLGRATRWWWRRQVSGKTTSSGCSSRAARSWWAGVGSRVVERFTRVSDGEINYRFTVEDPAIYSKPWLAEYSMMAAPKDPRARCSSLRLPRRQLRALQHPLRPASDRGAQGRGDEALKTFRQRQPRPRPPRPRPD